MMWRLLTLRPAARLLRITLFAGLILLVLLGGIMAGIVATKGSSAVRVVEKETTFHRLLREYDFKNRRILETETPVSRSQEMEELGRELDRLEKKAEGVESWLSVLKRRRQLVIDGGGRFGAAYRSSALRAAHTFPYSEPVAAVAAAALIHDAAITAETAARLRDMLPVLASSHFESMRLALHVLLGDFKSPATAVTGMPSVAGLLSDASADASASVDVEQVIIDLLIREILAGDIPGVAVDMQSALSAVTSPALTRLAAEFFYDFGEPLRSAELFSLLSDEAALGRQADALWLAGYTGNARAVWDMLSHSPEPGPPVNRALYNLALTAPTPEEAAARLETLAGQAGTPDAARRFGLIRFSRLFDTSRALAMLDAEKKHGGTETASADLIELEILRRRSETEEPGRIAGETWMLLERYPLTEALYEWGAWYFNLQRNYDESALLLKTAQKHNFTGQWLKTHEALHLIHAGDVDSAEKIFAALPEETTNWAAAANWGRILEARRSPARALEHYEKALAAVLGTTPAAGRELTASRMQVRIALCLKSLGKTEESRRALEYALDLNPDNLNARLELSRLEQ